MEGEDVRTVTGNFARLCGRLERLYEGKEPQVATAAAFYMGNLVKGYL